MDYKEKYEMALERAKEKYPACYSPALLEYIFPELKESEDEKIRKEIIEFLHLPHQQFVGKRNHEEWIEWLEKQGKKNLNDNVKPKFHEGDWIVFNGLTLYIKEVVNGYYRTISFDGINNSYDWDIDNIARLWTIQDAKDGDVLVSRSPFIYSKQCPYGGLNWCNNKFIKASNFIFTDSPVHPATKEQRDLLFQKMKEAEYIFDFKNKELKKIKNDIEIPFGAKDSELQEATYFIPKGFHAEIDDDKVVIKKGEKPAAWSKKDEKMFEYALHMIEWYSGKNEDKSRFVSDWLKSIKQRIGG